MKAKIFLIPVVAHFARSMGVSPLSYAKSMGETPMLRAKISKRAFTLIPTSLLLAAMLGCQSVNSVDVRADGSYNWIKGDSVLKNVARVRSAQKEMVDGLLHVQVVIHDTYKTPGEFKYRFVWYDANGFEVHTPLTTWEKVNILGKQTMTLDGVAPNSSVTDCRVEMFTND